MTFHNAVKHIQHAPIEHAHEYSFDRLQYLLKLLEEPQRRLRYVRLAGSNGKTLCGSMLEAVLCRSRTKVGVLVLSDLENPRGAIRIDGKDASMEELASLVGQVMSVAALLKKGKDAVSACLSKGENIPEAYADIPNSILQNTVPIEPTGAEILLLASLLYFQKNSCQICLIECNNQKNDPSLVLPPPIASVICGTIPTDTQDIKRYIGQGIREIVSAPQNEEAYRMLSDTCAAAHCRLSVPARSALHINRLSLHGTDFSYRGKAYSLSYCGRFQAMNAATVIEATGMLRRCGLQISDDDERMGIKQACLHGRFEVISCSPYIMVDSTYMPEPIEIVSEAMMDFPELTDKRVTLCLPPDASLIRRFYDALTKRGFDVCRVYTASHNAFSIDIPVECHVYPTVTKLIKDLLPGLASDDFVYVSGQHHFSLSVRYELLRQLGF